VFGREPEALAIRVAANIKLNEERGMKNGE
jgi:hypothetical protein